MKENETVKILLADDHALFRDGLRHVLTGIGTEIEIVEATDYPGALAMAHKEKGITLAFVDLSMPGMDRFSGLAALCDRMGEVPVVVSLPMKAMTTLAGQWNVGHRAISPRRWTAMSFAPP